MAKYEVWRILKIYFLFSWFLYIKEWRSVVKPIYIKPVISLKLKSWCHQNIGDSQVLIQEKYNSRKLSRRMLCNNLQFFNLTVSLLEKWNLFWISGSGLVFLHQHINQVETDDHADHCTQYVDEKWLHQHPWPHLIPLLILFFVRVNFLPDIQQSYLSADQVTRLTAGLYFTCN